MADISVTEARPAALFLFLGPFRDPDLPLAVSIGNQIRVSSRKLLDVRAGVFGA